MTSDACALVADIGGTNARLGLALELNAPIRYVRSYQCADFPDFQTLAAHYFKETGAPKPTSACLAIAGPVKNNRAKLTNGPWGIDGDVFAGQTDLEACELVNDFTALAWALPWLGADEIIPIGPDAQSPENVRLVVGPGTGLGVSVLIDEGKRRFAMASEGGHIGFAPTNKLEMELLRWFKTRHSRVSMERILSGDGLVLLHSALGEITDGNEAITGKSEVLSAPQIVARGLKQPDSISAQTLQHFLAMLGSFAGDLALMSGASSVYIGGGILPRMAALLPQSPFRDRFIAKGRFTDHLSAIPTLLITAQNPALKGARARLLDPATTGSPLRDMR